MQSFLVLVACASVPATPTATPIPLQRMEVELGGRLRVPLPETDRPPEKNPEVQLHLAFIDAVTEERVTAGRVLIDGEGVAEDTNGVCGV